MKIGKIIGGWLPLTFAVVVLMTRPAAATSVFINEIHYDNAGTDSGEFVEIAGPAGSLVGWSLVLYNGGSGLSYKTVDLSGDQIGYFQEIDSLFYGTFAKDISGIQNGAPDGLALIDADSKVVQFLSYEGSFTATNGLAAGLISTDIGVAEDGVAAGYSLQLTGTGLAYEDFTWSGPLPGTPSAFNTGQIFAGPAPAPVGAAPTPLPGTMLLLGSGLAGLAAARKKPPKAAG